LQQLEALLSSSSILDTKILLQTASIYIQQQQKEEYYSEQ